MIYFEIPLAGRTVGGNDAYTDIKGAVGANPQVEYSDGNSTIKIKVPWRSIGDLKTLSKKLFEALQSGAPRIGLDKRDQMIDAFGTPAYKKEVANWEQINDARETLRPTADNPKEQPDTSDLNMDAPATDVMKEIVKKSQGVCMARAHTEPDSLQAMIESIDKGDVEMLFLEEFSTHQQQDLNDYLTGVVPDMPPALESRINELKANFGGVDWKPVLEKAKAKGAKIYAIDNEEARDTPPESGLFEEHRDAQMNAVVFKVMDAALKDPANKNKKYMAVVGAAHANTHAGGIPGVCQMFGIPAVRIEGTKAKLEKENKALRGMPSKEEQIHMDLALQKGLKNLQPGSGKQGIEDLQKKVKAEAKVLKDTGALASFEEQIFAEEYVKAAKKGAHKDTPEHQLKAAALSKANELKLAGQLVPGTDMRTLVPPQGTVDTEVTNYAEFTKLAGALVPEAGNRKRPLTQEEKDEALDLIGKAPNVMNMTDKYGRNLLHLAAEKMDKDILKAVTDRLETLNVDLGSVIDTPDRSGNTPLHLTCVERLAIGGDDPKHQKQTDAMAFLLEKDADVIKQNKAGLTTLHLAARNNNKGAVKELFDNDADPELWDERGWTPIQLAQAVGSPDAEKTFYEEKKVKPKDIGDENAKISTIDMLMSVTMAEEHDDMEKIKATFEKLYHTPALRPIIELAALSAANKRNPPAGGCRFVVAKGKTIQNVYVQPGGGKAPGGAYDESANVVMIPSDPDEGDIAGVLMHEMTHMSAHILNGYGETVVPYGDDEDGEEVKKKYKEAIEKDIANMHLLDQSNPVEARIHNRIMQRMKLTGYDKAPYDNKSNEDVLYEEFLVGVPQLIAEFGEDVVKKHVPSMHQFFTEHTQRCTDKANSPTFAKAKKAIDDSAIRNLPETQYDSSKAETTWVAKDSPSVNLDAIMKSIKTHCTMQMGSPSGTDGSGDTINLKYNTDSVSISKDQEKELDKKLAKVRKGLAKSLDPKLFTTGVSGDGLKELVKSTSAMVSDPSVTDLEKATTAKTDRWLMNEKRAHIRNKLIKDPPLNDVELAEAVVLGAEFTAKGDRDYEVNTDKHATLVGEMAKGLAKLPANKKDRPFKQLGIIQTLTSQLDKGGDKSQGVYQKTGKKADPNHISIEVSIKKKWLKELATV